jgi:thioredoxin reductase (NADPH)
VAVRGQFVLTNAVQRLAVAGGTCTLTLTDGRVLGAHAVILATGVDYRRLEVPGLDAFIGAGVFYGSPLAEAPRLKGGRAFVVGAGNSAGQAAIHLADHGAVVTILARGIDLRETMSEYLVHEIEQAPRITVPTRTTLIAVHGEGRLKNHPARSRRSDRRAGRRGVRDGWRSPAHHMAAHTTARDTSGYVLTGTRRNRGQRSDLHSHMRPVCPASSRSEMCARARKSELRQRSVRDLSASNTSTSTCLSPVTQGPAHETARLSPPAPSVVPSARAPLRTPARFDRASGTTGQLM